MIRSVTVTLVLAVLLATLSVSAQEARTKTMTLSPDDASILPGIGALILLKDSALVVEMVPGPDNRPARFRDVDLKQGDIVLMCNGRRVTSPAALNQIIDSVKTGETVKLGIKRDGAMMISSFEKVESSGQPIMMTKTIDGPGAAGAWERKMEVGGPDGKDGTVLVLDGGLIIGHGDAGPMPVVIALLPDADDRLTGDMPEVGDEIVSINDNIDSNIVAFEEWYSGLPDGETITVVFKRGEKEMTCTYTKTKLQHGSMMIKQ